MTDPSVPPDRPNPSAAVPSVLARLAPGGQPWPATTSAGADLAPVALPAEPARAAALGASDLLVRRCRGGHWRSAPAQRPGRPLLTLPGAIRAGQSPPQVAVATSAAPDAAADVGHLAVFSNANASADGYRRRGIHPRHHRDDQRPAAIRARGGGGLGQRRERPVQLRRSAGALAPVRQALRLRPSQLPRPVARVGIRRLDAPADAAQGERPVRRRLVHRRHDAQEGLRQRRPASDRAVPRGQRRGQRSPHHPHALSAGCPWPQSGEEDYCEGDGSSGCHTFLHYGDTSTTQVWHRHAFDLSQWHTVRFERRNHVVKAYIDDLTKPVWTYNGSSRTLPDTKKQVVLQQSAWPQDVRPGPRAPRTSRSTGSPSTTRPEKGMW